MLSSSKVSISPSAAPRFASRPAFMRNTSAVAHLIREEKTHQLYAILETHARDGMKTFDASLKDLYLRGQIEFEEARRRMRNPTLLEKT